jgi:CBS domain-containing protein
MNVARILKDKGRNVVTALPDTKISEIVRTLGANRIGALVVCDADKHVVGIVSERDIVRILALHGPAVMELPVSQHMTKEVVTCTERDTVEWLMEEMTTHRFRHVPVVEGGKLIGIVSIGDVVKLRLAAAELEASSMRDYIKTG